MDTFDLFRKLGSGARFDLKRFSRDAEKFKVTKSKESDLHSSNVSKSLDFFGNQTKPLPKKCENGMAATEVSGKTTVKKYPGQTEKGDVSTKGQTRKINGDVGKKAKKRKRDAADTEPTPENDSILWMSSLEANLKDNREKKQKKPTAEKLEQQRLEKINNFRNKHKIYIQGTDIPEPIATFEQLQQEYKIHPRMMQNVREAGFQTPTPIQMQAVPIMLHTHRELVKLSEGIGFRIHMINKTAVAAKKFGPKSSKKYDILVTTPNRLIYLLKQDPPGIDLSSVEWLVVDESDKLFEDGKMGFRDQLASIFVACTSHLVKRAMFSATFAHDVEQWCKLHLDSAVSVSVGARNSAADTVEQSLLFVGSETGKLLAMRDLIKKGFSPPVLVFVQSIDRAKELFHELIYEGINVDAIHADRTQQQRDNVIRSFREGKIWVLICTALLARGIDFKGVNMVINYDFPTSAVEYIHRIGRTGRAGHKGKALSFFTEDDKPLLRSVASVIQQAGCPVPDYIKHFRKLQSKQKKRMIKNPLKRQQIRTTPKYILEKAKRKKNIIKKNLKEKKNVAVPERSQKQAAPES
ncbi:hypothetical protein FKM82_008621 [Ascaphus truei]